MMEIGLKIRVAAAVSLHMKTLTVHRFLRTQICNIPSVKENCRVTCNNSCVNRQKDCPYMTATLGCTNHTNDGGMAKYCRKSRGFYTRPVNYKLNLTVITKCTKTCNSECATKSGSQHLLCVDQDKNSEKIAAQKGCFGLFYDK